MEGLLPIAIYTLLWRLGLWILNQPTSPFSQVRPLFPARPVAGRGTSFGQSGVLSGTAALKSVRFPACCEIWLFLGILTDLCWLDGSVTGWTG